jgi:Flp pilus assembly protein TadB
MTTPMALVVAGCLTAAGLAFAFGRPVLGGRARRRSGGRAGALGRRPSRATVRPNQESREPDGSAARPEHTRRDLRRPAAVLAGVAVALLVGGWAGIVCAVLVAVAASWALRRLPSAHARADAARCAADLPLGADLVAAALRCGAPVDRAVTAVAGTLGGPFGERLLRVGRALRLGADPAEAWQHLLDVPGAERLAVAAVRSSASGGALAGALTRLADDLRADRAVAAEAAVRRAGVLMVLPLGLCFLPAFVLAGLAPVIVAVLGDVL